MAEPETKRKRVDDDSAAAAAAAPALRVPAPPAALFTGAAPAAADGADGWAALEAEMKQNEAARSTTWDQARALSAAAHAAMHTLNFRGAGAEAEAAVAAAMAALAALPAAALAAAPKRDGKVGEAVETLVCVHILTHFFRTGRLAVDAAACPALRLLEDGGAVQDAEYVSGLFGAAAALPAYATRRATAGDVASVRVCRDAVDELNGAAMAFGEFGA